MSPTLHKISKALVAYCLILSPCVFALGEKSYIHTQASSGDFLLASVEQTATLYVDDKDFAGVIRAAKNLQTDIEKVTHQKPTLINEIKSPQKLAVLIGTLGHSTVIDELVRTKKIDVSKILNQWDAFQLQIVDHPTKNIERALVIVGSNKRGTTYGIYDLTEQMGVSPWYWWADVPIKQKSSVYIDKNIHVTEMPKIQYRGIFLNDEAPALTNWVKANHGNFTHEFYEKVFELLLRMKANFLWPAMWNNAFADDDIQNMILADEYGIVMSTSHHEPMMRADKEWDRHGSGVWDYARNDKNLYNFWMDGAKRNKDYESIYTMGMRGQADTPMSEGENVSLLERIVRDQREIIGKVFGEDKVTKVPQVWALYKEVQSYYEHGMRVPDDVILLWCDDNWGNIRRLPTPDERKRVGGAGVYYHFDYVGGPRSYRWINTVPIAKVWEQMNLAYQMDARKIWLVNVGDLKPMEYPIEFFLRMAWNPEAWPKEKIPEYSRLWAAREFGEPFANDIAELLVGYTQHNLRRKPELQDETIYSQLNYREAEAVTENIKNLREKAEKIGSKISPEYKDAYFELVLHPVKASAIITEMYDAVAKNHLYANQNRNYANEFAKKARELFQADQALQNEWDTKLANGKWAHFMDQSHIGYSYWNNPPTNVLPVLYDYQAHAKPDMGISVEGMTDAWPTPGNYSLQTFDPYGQQNRRIEIFNKGKETFTASITPSEPWIKVSKTQLEISGSAASPVDSRIDVSIDWSKAPEGAAQGKIQIKGASWGGASVKVAIQKPKAPPKGTKAFIEADGVVAIRAENFSQSKSAKGIQWEKIPQHGRHLGSISTFPFTDESFSDVKSAPWVEYPLYLFSTGKFNLDIEVAPTWAFTPNKGLKFAVALDGAEPQVVDAAADRSSQAWEESVKSDRRIVSTTLNVTQPGVHTLRIYSVDAGVVIEKLVINTGGLLPSYLGPKEVDLH